MAMSDTIKMTIDGRRYVASSSSAPAYDGNVALVHAITIDPDTGALASSDSAVLAPDAGPVAVLATARWAPLAF